MPQQWYDPNKFALPPSPEKMLRTKRDTARIGPTPSSIGEVSPIDKTGIKPYKKPYQQRTLEFITGLDVDKLWEDPMDALTEGVVNNVGGAGAMKLAGVLPAALIPLAKKINARRLATKAAEVKFTGESGRNALAAVEELAERFPRVMSTVENIKPDTNPSNYVGLFRPTRDIHSGAEMLPAKILERNKAMQDAFGESLDPRYFKGVGEIDLKIPQDRGISDYYHTGAHELAHAAQGSLTHGRKNIDYLSSVGYKLNPNEISARTIADRKSLERIADKMGRRRDTHSYLNDWVSEANVALNNHPFYGAMKEKTEFINTILPEWGRKFNLEKLGKQFNIKLKDGVPQIEVLRMKK
jgi:hypothetical protein